MSTQLLVGPFPLSIQRGPREELMKHYGAISNIHRKKGQKESHIIGRFKSFEECELAMKSIHQMKILNRRLIAKYYYDENFHIEPHEKSITTSKDQVELSSKVKAALKKYEANISSISTHFDVNFPISPLLRYKYPPATMDVIDNISLALMTHSKFYTQVLHLMNKMNLPCPFEQVSHRKRIEKFTEIQKVSVMHHKSGIDPTVTEKIQNERIPDVETRAEVDTDVLNVQNMSESETSSELESDEDWKEKQFKKSNPKRVKRQKRTINKRMKLEDMKKALSTNVDVERHKENAAISESAKNAFDLSIDVQQNKKLEVKLQSKCLPELSAVSMSLEDSKSIYGENISGFGKIFPAMQDNLVKNDEAQEKSKSNYINLKQLEENRVSRSDWPMLSVFKNYSPGIQSRKLYLKNIAKTVTEGDLKFIFGRFVCWEFIEEATSFNIQLMRGGRMKGQGFITFSNEEAATKALKETNGYILKDKPIVVMFGKIDKDKEASDHNA